MMSYIKVCFYNSLILTTCFHDSVKSNVRIDRTCFKQIFAISHIVVATTRHSRTNDLTTSKALQ